MEFQIAEGRTAVAIHKQNKPDFGVTFEDNIMQTSSLCQPCSILSNIFLKGQKIIQNRSKPSLYFHYVDLYGVKILNAVNFLTVNLKKGKENYTRGIALKGEK